MCGIAGFIGKGHQVNMACVPSIFEQLRHRGPDDYGYLAYSNGHAHLGREGAESHQNPEVLFLHRRLSILDLSRSGRQPMGTADSRYFITFNGEIYNYRELRQELEQLGYQFRSRSDTEVLLAAYVAWGPQALRRLIGMFAFAILDTVRHVVFLARDFFGIKPLYYAATPQFVAFASEMKTLLEFGGVSHRANANRLFSFLRHGLCDFGDQTLIADVLQIPPAHYLEIPLKGNSQPPPVCYWDPAIEASTDLSFDDAADQLRALFLKSVSLHLRSDVTVGSALSGGIDSSSVLMAMRHLEPDIDLHAFSYIADDSSLSEEKWVDLVGSAARAHVHKVFPSAEALIADFERLSYMQDIPSASTSPFAQCCVFEAAHNAGIKVMLDGQGADEILGGYTYFRGARLASLVRQKRWRNAADFASNAGRLPGCTRSGLLQHASEYLLPAALQVLLRKMVGRDLMPPWLNVSWFEANGVLPHFSDRAFNSSHVLREKLRRELSEHLPTLLRYEDRSSMAFSIESRVPFLTPELVSFVLSLPEEYIIAPDGTSKAVFRRAMRDIVPDAILDRKDKIGFNTPEQVWLSSVAHWVQRKLDADVAVEITPLRLDKVRCEWEEIKSGRKRFSSFVWRCLNVIAWTERFKIQYC